MPKEKSVVKFPKDGFPCYAMTDRANVTIDVCRSLTSDPNTNRRFCTKKYCGCPARICESCVRDKFFDESARSINAQPGLCAFHTANGREAVRSSEEPNYPIDLARTPGMITSSYTTPAFRARGTSIFGPVATMAELVPAEWRSEPQPSRTADMVRCSYYIPLNGGTREVCKNFLVSPEKYAQLEKDGLLL